MFDQAMTKVIRWLTRNWRSRRSHSGGSEILEHEAPK
jgi:hypothetical protein